MNPSLTPNITVPASLHPHILFLRCNEILEKRGEPPHTQSLPDAASIRGSPHSEAWHSVSSMLGFRWNIRPYQNDVKAERKQRGCQTPSPPFLGF